ncbi:GNAT family N-acetyltransferase, partial [Coprobacillus cateniformis]|nr:GNAT family N-acetyltransferase [Coprobacillus cateniformis]
CYFILGVATKKNFEKQGYMKKLLQFVLEQYNNQIIYLQAYHPEIYKPFGFNASHYHQKIAVDKEKLIQSPCIPIDDISLLKDYYEAFVQQFDEYRIRDEYYWKLFIQRCLVFFDNILIFKDHGYLIYHENDESIEISEFIYLTKDSIN